MFFAIFTPFYLGIIVHRQRRRLPGGIRCFLPVVRLLFHHFCLDTRLVLPASIFSVCYGLDMTHYAELLMMRVEDSGGGRKSKTDVCKRNEVARGFGCAGR
jgi:hypothetical protein